MLLHLSVQYRDLLVSSRPCLGVMAAVLTVNSQLLDGLPSKRVDILLYIHAKGNWGFCGTKAKPAGSRYLIKCDRGSPITVRKLILSGSRIMPR